MLFTLGLAALATVSSACAAEPPPGASTSSAASSTAAPGDSAEQWRSATPRANPTVGTQPRAMSLPTLGLDAPVEPVGVEDGVLEVPPQSSTVGWWREGAAPGSRTGTVVLDVHRDTREEGRGPFAAAERLRRGDAATVTDAAGEVHRYRVTRVTTYEKESLPYGELFSQSGPARMVLVTCGGTYRPSAGGWDSNVVIQFEPVGRG